MTSAYPFRRGAAVLVNAVADEIPKRSGKFLPSPVHTTEIGQLRSALCDRGFEVVLELGPGSATPEPSAADISEQIHTLVSRWQCPRTGQQWDADHFDALVVVIASHGRLDRILPWPNAR